MRQRCLGCMAEYESTYEVCPYCGYEAGAPAESPLHMAPGTLLAGRYLIGRVLGYGGFGVTYLGWDQVLGQAVAVKEYLPSEFATRMAGQSRVTVFQGNKAQQFADGLGKFVDEAKRLVKFQDEPGIVRVFDSFEANQTAYLVMEYLEGETLAACLEREGKLPPERAVALLEPVIRSLEAVHQAGILHRDIAPDNIFLTRDGRVKLIDFGAARYATTSHSRSLTVIIKPGYSPEEQYRSRGDQGPWTDVYALAAVLYRMITGVTPPDALERRAWLEKKRKDILEPPSRHAKLDRDLENAILNAMNVRVEDRTASAEAFWQELTSPDGVKRRSGHIKPLDVLRWPLALKIAVPAAGALVLVLLALLFTGHLGEQAELNTEIALGEGMTRVPSVVNYSVGVAQEMLDDQSLRPVIGGRKRSDTIPVDLVLYQSVDAGAVVEEDTQVELYLSAPLEAETPEGTAPDVAYYALEEASALLTQMGAVVSVEYEYSADVAQGIVIRQSVEMGEPLSAGTPVTLYVSQGPDPALEQPAEEGTSESQAPQSAPLQLNRSSLRLYVGDRVTLRASGGGGSYRWSSSDSSVVSVSNGSVTAAGAGQATITVSSGGSSVSCSVVVQDYTPRLNRSTLTLSAGAQATLSASGYPSGVSVRWSSSNSAVASVSASGVITAQSPGSCTITAQCSLSGRTYSAACAVTVAEGEVGSVVLSESSLLLTLGGGTSLGTDAAVYPSNASISWQSSDPAVAEVSAYGWVTPKQGGEATITASIVHNGQVYSDHCTVRVVEPEISLSDTSLTLTPGEWEILSVGSYPYEPDEILWESADSQVATAGGGSVTAQGEGRTTITVTAVFGSYRCHAACSVTVTPTAGLTISSSGISLLEGETYWLDADATPAGQSITWRSDDSSVASVSSSGRVTAEGTGSTTIVASMTYDGVLYSDSCHVSVSSGGSLTLSDHTLALEAGQQRTLTARTSPTNSSVTWRSSDSGVASVSSSGAVTAVGAGSATITASMTYGNTTYSDECRVTVSEAAGITLSHSSLTLEVPLSQDLTVYTTPAGQRVTWSSSDPGVASVSSSGRVTAEGGGSATITASMTYGGQTYSASCAVTVEVPEIIGNVTIEPGELALSVGESQTLGFSSSFTNTTDIGPTVWSSSDSDIAAVSGGTVTAKGEGTAVITASVTAGGQTFRDQCTVTVSAREPENIVIPVSLSIGSNDAVSERIHQGDTVTLDIDIDTGGESGEELFTLWVARLDGYSWEQLGAYYVDGSTHTTLDLDISSLDTNGSDTFAVSLFYSDNFSTGNSLGDILIRLVVV